MSTADRPPWRYRPDVKDVGVEQAAFRVSNVSAGLEAARQAALARGRPGQARRLEIQRQGVAMALEAMAELRRNYRGHE